MEVEILQEISDRLGDIFWGLYALFCILVVMLFFKNMGGKRG